MSPVFRPVREVAGRQFRIMDHEQVLCVGRLRGFREVERAGHDDRAVDHDDLVVRNRVLGVDERRDASVREEVGLRVVRRLM